MRYLLSATMRFLNDPTSQHRSAAQTELQEFVAGCREQVFEALSDLNLSDFIIKQYHSDLYLITQKATRDDIISVSDANIEWLLETYPSFINRQLPVPYEFKKRTLSPVVGNDENLIELITPAMSYDQLIMIKAGLLKEEPQKINLSLSVSQLGVWLHLLYEMKFFSGVSKIDLIRFVSSNFSTKRQETISYDSLYGKYFKMEESSVEFIKEQLFEMLNFIKKRK